MSTPANRLAHLEPDWAGVGITKQQYDAAPRLASVRVHLGSRTVTETDDITVETLLARPTWWNDAACRGQGTEAFFPSRGTNTHEATRALCASCPALAACAEAGEWEAYGIWGGRNVLERRRARRRRSA